LVEEGNFDLIKGLVDEDLSFFVFLLIFLEEFRPNFEHFIKIMFFYFFINAFDKLGFKGLVGFCGFFDRKILFKLLVVFRDGIEIVLELCV
jgi:hypothetical protein